MLYLVYPADLPLALGSTAIYADGTAVLLAHNDYIESLRLQENFSYIQS